MSDLHYIVRELQRRVANMVRRGRVHSVDFGQMPPRVRVEYAPNAVTAWLPWISGRASTYKQDWEPLVIGEAVLILSESGDLAAGVVIPSIADSITIVPSTSEFEHVSQYQDGTKLVYNRDSHKLTITIGSEGTTELNCKTFFINADIEQNGKLHSTGDIQSDANVSDSTRSMADDRGIYNSHKHAHGSPNTSTPDKSQ
ncbi:phage baseplate assembly protein V [Shewanella surugensis]|uniref:Phage baseplate assembly protein V n=1 Tax=Shewanella surugensis TaxID=212020 RepID=A0ABT0L951_9GAMM|nr:phage baseplate assembly protein V [Shewanella surugensis]MCL1124160.1 phage baseplate assembly protein V [Shewanella surugensis]